MKPDLLPAAMQAIADSGGFEEFAGPLLGNAKFDADRCSDGAPHELGPIATGADGDVIASGRHCSRCGVVVVDVVRLSA